jgi:hypothetical protein
MCFLFNFFLFLFELYCQVVENIEKYDRRRLFNLIYDINDGNRRNVFTAADGRDPLP